MWSVEVTRNFARWYSTLSEAEQDAVNAAVDLLEEQGPSLRRPVVGEIVTSHLKNLKELIPPIGNLRILFAFDPRRTAILLIGGDKSGQWQAWYDEMIPKAEALCEEYLKELRQEDVSP